MVITFDQKTGLAYLNGKPIGSQELRNLKEEVKMFRKMQISGILLNTIADQSRTIMNEKAASYEDMRHGKMMLHTISTQKSILDVIESAKILDGN